MKRGWTPEQVEQLKRLFPHESTKAVAEALGKSISTVNNKAYGLGLKKSRKYLESQKPGWLTGEQGEDYRFKKGQEAWNKGKSYVAGGRSAETRFKKGEKPHTWLPVGSERITKDGIRQRKVTDSGYPPNDWKSVHSLLWEEHHGPIPKGHVVVFRNGNREEIRIENLEMITRGELARRNSIHRYPEELKQLMRISGRLKSAIRKQEKPGT